MRSALLMLVLLPVVGFAEKLMPVDESASDPTFVEFKTRLLGAIQRKDITTLVSILDPEVRVKSDGESGVEAFRRYWQLDKLAPSRVWDELGTVLRLGATKDDSEFIAPYVFTRFPHTVDAQTHFAVVRAAVDLRSAPSLTAPKVATLQHDIVQRIGVPKGGWVEVRTEDKKTGWLQESDLRSPMDYRAFFEQKQGRWKITAFLNGGD
jgi:hypothetical protein